MMSDRRPGADELGLDVNAGGISLSSKGGTAARLGASIVDALSPFTGALGWMGDHLTIRRREAVLRAARKAEEKLRSEGITKSDVPPKILLPWLEGASMETEDSSILTDMWAGLFARSAKSADAAVISYIESLKKIGAEEARLLEFFATDRSPHFSQAFYTDAFESWSMNNPLFWNKASPLIEQNDVWRFKEWIETVAIQSMRQVIFVRDGDGNTYPSEYFIEHEHAISNMDNLGIINIREKSFIAAERQVDVIWFQISKYGFDLIWAAKGKITGIKAGKTKTGLAE